LVSASISSVFIGWFGLLYTAEICIWLGPMDISTVVDKIVVGMIIRLCHHRRDRVVLRCYLNDRRGSYGVLIG